MKQSAVVLLQGITPCIQVVTGLPPVETFHDVMGWRREQEERGDIQQPLCGGPEGWRP